MSKTAVLPLGFLLLLAVAAFLILPAVQDVDLSGIGYQSPGDISVYYDGTEADLDYAWMSIEHAVERHGAIAYTIVDLCNSNPQMQFKNYETGRKATACFLDNVMGFMIEEENGDLVTAFPSRCKTIEQAIKFMKNRGMIPIE